MGIVFVAACAKPPPPKPPPAQLPITGVASIAGDWVTDDEMGWNYSLVIDGTGAFLAKLERGKLPGCEQKGTLSPGSAAKRFALALTKNTCESPFTAAEVDVASFTGEHLTVVVTPPSGVSQQRTYHRRPSP